MNARRYDAFLAKVLRKERAAFGFAAHPAYQIDLPSELVWVLIRALVHEKQLTLNTAARVVLDFTERQGAHIPRLLRGGHLTGERASEVEAEEQPCRFSH